MLRNVIIVIVFYCQTVFIFFPTTRYYFVHRLCLISITNTFIYRPFNFPAPTALQFLIGLSPVDNAGRPSKCYFFFFLKHFELIFCLKYNVIDPRIIISKVASYTLRNEKKNNHKKYHFFVYTYRYLFMIMECSENAISFT